MDVPTAIISHGDVDGLVCAAQLIRREKSNCQVFFSNASGIAKKLSDLLAEERPPSRVYVADIPADWKAAAVADKLVTAGAELYWIDHHPWHEDGLLEHMQAICKAVVYNNATRTPAGTLLGTWLAQEDPYCEKIGRICYAYAEGSPWERNWFRLLSSMVGLADRTVLDRLAFDLPLTDADLEQIAKQERAEGQSKELLLEEPQVIRTGAGKSLAVYDTSAMPGVFLGRQVFTHHNVDYCLIRISAFKWQLACRPASGLPLERMMGTHDLDGLPITVAGRPKQLLSVAAARHSCLPADAHNRVIGLIQSIL